MDSIEVSLVLVLSIFVLLFVLVYDWPSIRTRKLINKIPSYCSTYYFVLKASRIRPEESLDLLEEILQGNYHITKMWFMGIPNVFISTPEDLEIVMSSMNHITKGREYEALLPWLNEGLLTSTGSKWHTRRKILTPPFHFKILEDCLPVFNRNAALLVMKLMEEAKKGEVFELDPYITLCTLDVICEAAMGINLQAQNNEAKHYVSAVRRMGELVIERVSNFLLTRYWMFYFSHLYREQKKVLETLHGFTNSVIRERRELYRSQPSIYDSNGTGKRRKAFLDCLIEVAEKNPGLLSDKDIQEEVDTFMFEGHETTSAGITWTTFLLGSNPQIQENAYSELLDIFGDSQRAVTMEDLNNMRYLERVIKEGLRLYPPVSYMSRKLTEDLQLKHFLLPAHSNIVILPYFVHRNPEIYPDPEVFDPDRFLPDEVQKRHPFTYIPFSGGPRNCIGQKFAFMELKVVLSHIIRNFRIETHTRKEDLKLLTGPILRNVKPIRVKLIPRTQNK